MRNFSPYCFLVVLCPAVKVFSLTCSHQYSADIFKKPSRRFLELFKLCSIFFFYFAMQILSILEFLSLSPQPRSSCRPRLNCPWNHLQAINWARVVSTMLVFLFLGIKLLWYIFVWFFCLLHYLPPWTSFLNKNINKFQINKLIN